MSRGTEEGEGLHRSQPRLAVLGGDRKPPLGGGVGASAMPKGSDEEDARAGGHDDRQRVIVWAKPTPAPAVAAG